MKKIILLLLIGVGSLFAYDGYYAPYKAGTTLRVSQGYDGILSHHGAGYAYAIDIAGQFDIYPSKDGTVDKIGTDSTIIDFCRNNPQHWHGPANYIRIKHNDGVFSYYYHLGQISVVDEQKVYAGTTKLGVSGNTGCSTSTHLHLQFSNRASMSTASSLKIRFEDIGYPIRNNSYTSKNIGSYLSVYDFWVKTGDIYTNSKFDAQFKLKNNSSQTMDITSIALSLHDANNQFVKDMKVVHGIYIEAGKSYETGFTEIKTPSSAGKYFVVAKYQKNNGEWVELSSQKIDIKVNTNINTITRAKALKLILDKFKISTKNAGFNNSRFGQNIKIPSDVTSNTSNYDAIVVGYNRGIITGSNGKFLPINKISLEEFITMIVRTIPVPLDNPKYKNYSYATNSNFYKYLKAAYNANILENKSYKFEDSIDESTANSLLNKAFEYFRGTKSGISIYLKWNQKYVDLDMYAYSPADSSNIKIEKDDNNYITNMSALSSNILYYGRHSTDWGANLDYDSWGGNGSQPWAGFGEERATVDSLMVKRPGTYSFIICYYDWGNSLNPSNASYEMIGYKGSKNITNGGSIQGSIQKGKCKVGGTLTTR